MERGVLWLPLLGMFCVLAWLGWQEYQKVEAYRLWSQEFDKSKYDTYAVLGFKDNHITWGKPTRKGPIELQKFSLGDVKKIRLLVGDQPVDEGNLPTKGNPIVEFIMADNSSPVKIPFTEIPLAAQWMAYLQQQKYINNAGLSQP